MVRLGINVMLMRDVTDSFHNGKTPPNINHFRGTDLIVEWYEKYWCLTITSDQVLGGAPFRFKDDKPN